MPAYTLVMLIRQLFSVFGFNGVPRGRISLYISLHLSIRRFCQVICPYLMRDALVDGCHAVCRFHTSPTVGSSTDSEAGSIKINSG